MSLLNSFVLFPGGTAVLPKKVFFLVPNTGSPAARDSEVKTLLEGDGWTVDYKDETDLTAPADLDTYGVLLISHGVVDGNVTDPDAALGIDIGVVWIGRRIDTDHDIGNLDTTASRKSIEIVDVAHPITSFFGSTGSYEIYPSSTPHSTSTTTGGSILARVDDPTTGDICFWAYEKGDSRVTSGVYGGRRVITNIQGAGGERIDHAPNYYGQTLLLRSLDWATYRL